MLPTISRPLPPDALAALRSVAEVCDVLRGWGRPDLAERLAYFASDEDLDDGDIPVTVDSAVGFLAFFGAVESEGKIGLACSPEGWVSAQWDFADARIAVLQFRDSAQVMFAARGYDGFFMDLNNGSEMGNLKDTTAKLAETELFTWFKGSKVGADSYLPTT